MDYLLCGKRCDMKNKGSPKTIRRSVALSRQLVAEVSALAPPELRHNLNRLVTVALREFANQQRARAFEEAMGQMAVDPAIRSECAAISREFSITEADGLPVRDTQTKLKDD